MAEEMVAMAEETVAMAEETVAMAETSLLRPVIDPVVLRLLGPATSFS